MAIFVCPLCYCTQSKTLLSPRQRAELFVFERNYKYILFVYNCIDNGEPEKLSMYLLPGFQVTFNNV